VLTDVVDGICVELREVPGHHALQHRPFHRQRQPLAMSEKQRYCKFKTSLSFITVMRMVKLSCNDDKLKVMHFTALSQKVA